MKIRYTYLLNVIDNNSIVFFPGHLDYTLLNQYSCDWWWKPKHQPTLHCVFMYWDPAIVSVDGTCDVTAEEDDTDYFTTMDTDSVSGVSSVTTEHRGNAQLNFLHLCLSLCLSVRPKSPPAPCPPPPPAPACMTACYRDTPKPSSSRSSAADVTNPSHWMLAFILSIYFCMEI